MKPSDLKLALGNCLTRAFSSSRSGPPAVTALVFAATLMSGCAMTQGRLALSGNVVSNDVSQTTGRSVIVGMGGCRDERVERSRVGIKKNGYGWETADVVAGGREVEWIAESLAASLKRAGLEPLGRAGSNSPRIGCEVRQVFVEPKVGAFTGDVTGKVVVIISVEMADGAAYERKFSGVHTETGVLIWTEKVMEKCLRAALADLIKRAVPEITDLLRRNSA